MKNTEPTQNHLMDRPASAAGSFYPKDPEVLKINLQSAFFNAKPRQAEGEVLAIVCPHAGYVYSAKVAASAFHQIDATKTYEHIFVIGSSHRVQFNGASIFITGNYVTPLGRVKTDIIARELLKNNSIFNDDPIPHQNEHAIEVQIPFLQSIFHRNFSIVPIILGTKSPETCKKIAIALQPYFNSKNLFVISTDFSHYPPYESAKQVDSMMAKAVVTNIPDSFLVKLNEVEENKIIPNLLTGMCGWTSVLTMLYITSTMPNISIHMVDYQNSGDTEGGDKSKVVGYVALSVEQNLNEEFSLTSKDQQDLLKLARESIGEYLKTGIVPEPDSSIYSFSAKQSAGAFVTLMIHGELRGCIGNMVSKKPLYKMVRDMAIAAAVNDYRFDPLTIHELKNLRIEISVLTPMHKITSIHEIKLGKHGIYIQKEGKKGTLLPQVSVERSWTVVEFLGYCSRDKAGLGWNGWQDADIYVYETLAFSE